MYKIEKNIPIPPIRRRPGTQMAFLSRLRIGDSFLIQSKQVSTWYSLSKKSKIKITARKEKCSHRIWRIA